ncbi:tandem large repeat [Vibrio alginolyticus]|uniref:tandem large repeat n=1 Tax=Vibrio alginolyticus TaxID=663 RepID=UPI003752BE0C
MFAKNTLKLTLGLTLTSLLLSACGGGDGGDNTPPARSKGSISGMVFDAPVNGAKIEVFEFKNGNLGRKLANTTSDAFGNYLLEFESSSMPLFVVAKEGSYTDPFTNETVSVSNAKTLKFEGVVNFKEGSEQKLMLTPLSNLAAGLAKYKISQGATDESAFSTALDSINSMYGFDVNETKPIDITKGGQSSFASTGHQYGALLTAYSSYSYDLIKKYGNSDNVYTSMHFADIQYRDVIADGVLDGLEVSKTSGAVTPLSFGQKKINSDVYTRDLSQHVLIVVNDPSINISGTDAADYVDFSKKLNDLGTYGSTDGVIPPRDGTEIDTTAPIVTRIDRDVLAGTDKVDLKIVDDIGVEDVSAFIQYQINGSWSGEFQCNDIQDFGSTFCSVEFDDFEVGLRETNVKVNINTKEIDSVDMNPATGLSNVTAARLVLYTADVLGNELIPGSHSGLHINFEWDNDAPVIDITSASAINNQLKEYVLKGVVKESSQEISSVSISFKDGLHEGVTCSPVTVESGNACEFSKAYPTDEFLSTTVFEVRAKDSKGNTGSAQHAVSRDDQAPAQTITYPEGTSMTYVNVGLDGERTTYDGIYSQDTYTPDNVQASRDFLKIDYAYASLGIQNSLKGIDFSNFNANLLKENKIPYVRVKVSDVNTDTVLGSNANKLKLVVKYYVSQNNDNNYSLQQVIDTTASDDDYIAKIPHETVLDSNGRVEDVIYYIPFVRDILGDSFKSVSENSSQKLVIQTVDESDNESTPREVYFRSSFDLPTIKVVTPFIGARAQLEGLSPSGEFTSLASCTTIQQLESDQSMALDVASCETTTDVVNYDFMRVRLIGIEGSEPYYYQWKRAPGTKKVTVDLNKANIGVYFKLKGSQTYYITELSTYQTGLFDFQWDQVTAGEKTSERAIQILDEVRYALSGTNNNSFFGFDPTVVSYATNEMLTTKAIPDKPSNDYLHRFLVEAIDSIAERMPRNNSLDFASAIYDDFSYDGKANGVGAGGSQVTLDSYTFGAETYRKDLAQSYYEIMASKYGIETNIAQLYADDISMANPDLNGKNIFDTEGSSIDTLPPQPKLTIESGRETMVGNRLYIAGEVVSKIVLDDPSGIVGTDAHGPKFSTMWYQANEPNIEIPLDINIVENSDSSNAYRKEYFFTLNSQSSELKDIIEFAVETSAMDSHGNAYGYNGKSPFIESVFIDNDFPKASYLPPNDVDGKPVENGIYLNANNTHELTFNVEDIVGDKLASRGLVFYQQTGEKVTYTPENFASNSKDEFKVKLCTGEICSNQGSTIYPGDGDWLVVAAAEDNLGNSVSELTSTAPRFNIRIDSEAPIVKSEQVQSRLGGNNQWTPVIDWGTLSSGNNVKIDLRRGSGQALTLESCDPLTEVCDVPYLVGEQPDVKVQLVSKAFDYDEWNEFYVTATDNAYPANVSTTGKFTFQVDNKGPEIILNTPWVEDTLSKENYVIGREFNVRFKSVIDDSDLEQVSLYQSGKDSPIKTIVPTDSSKEFVMSLIKSDTDKIDISEDEKTTSLYVKATDIYGFESSSNTHKVILDRDGPTLGLSGFNANDYYLGNYVFDLTALDLNANGDVSINGVNRESLEYWTFSDLEPLPGSPGTKINEDLKVSLGDLGSGTHKIRLKGSDVRGNTTLTSDEQDFTVKVYNSIPQVTLAMSYTDGTPITNNTIYQDGNIVLTLDIVDDSGVDRIDSTYRFSGEQNGTNFTFSETADGTWTATLLSTQIAKDGNYELDIKVYNKVRYLDEKDRKVGKVNQTFSVQREGVVLTVESPLDFQNYLSDGVLDVTFTTLSAVKAKTLECWVREEYNSLDAPPTNEQPTSGVINVSQEPYSCSVNVGQNMTKAPVTLITKTLGTNGRETINKFNFSMVDIDAPTVVDGNSYSFKGSDVWFDEALKKKMLTFELSFNDALSGVNTESSDEYPKLVRNLGNKAYTPTTCAKGVGNIKCTYSESYADIIDGLSTTQEYKIKNLSDLAGNLTPEHDLLLELPKGSVVVEITDPVGNTTINGQQLVAKFRIKLYENSRLDNVMARFGTESYNYKDNPEKFAQLEVCADDPTYKCSTFTSELPSDADGKTIRTTITATDVWSRVGEATVDIKVDNTSPSVGDEIIVTESPTNPDNVRFRFDITDTGSSLAKVNYSVLNPSYQEERVEDGNGSSTYFELSKSQLEGRGSITVDIKATDSVGLYSDIRKVIDISVPKVTVDFDGITSLQGGKLFLTKASQPFTVSTVEGERVKASQYSVELIPSLGDSLRYSGDVISSSGNGMMNFAVDNQGAYTLKVTDSVGRENTSFELLGKSYDGQVIESIVDYDAPSISGLSANQTSKVPTNDKYQLEISAYITDKNLNLVTSKAVSGGSTVAPQAITEPTTEAGPYVISYLLPKGDHTITVAATDKVDNKSESSIDAHVEAATVPGLSISTASSAPLFGGEEITLTFNFTEEVTNFDISDVHLVASDNGATGTLKQDTWSTSDNVTWTVNYISPEKQDKNITIQVEDDSYQSINTIPGKGSSLSIAVEGTLPKLTNVTFNPEHQSVGQSVSVSLEFDKELQEATATLGGNRISSLSATADKKVWIGDVQVPSTALLSVDLVVSQFKDLTGNIGEDNTAHELPITPTLAITPVGNVDETHAATLQFEGTSTRFDGQSLRLEVKAQGSATVLKSSSATVQAGGTWTSDAIDMSHQTNGTYTVMVTGMNSAGIEVSESQSFTLAQSLPTLTNVTFTPEHQAIGQSVTVTLEFDKDLQSAAAELGGTTITSLMATADPSVWTGDVVVPSTSELNVALLVRDYQDFSGNTGSQNTAYSMPITPTLAITPVGNVDEAHAATLQFEGTSTRFDGQSLRLEVKAQGGATVLKSSSATVQAGGTWTSDAMDMSHQTNGTYIVMVTGTNSAGIEVSESQSFTLAQSLPMLTNVTFTPEHQAIGQSVTVTLEFDKDLQSAAAELGGTTITSLVATADPSVWTGDVVVPDSSELNVALLVRDYQDLSGNTGSQNTVYSMPITPTLAITPMGNVDETHAATLQFEGTSTRFDGQSLRLEVKAQGSATVLKSSSATVQAGGNWTSDAIDMSHQTNGTYTVMVTGTNSAGIEVSESQSFTLAQSLPTLTYVTFTPEHQAIGQSVTVTLEFDKDLQSAAAELGGTTITSLMATADPSIWTGDVVVPSTSELNVALLVRDYQDLSGNTGSQNTAYSMPITPTLAITPVGNVDETHAATLQFEGTSTRFDGQSLRLEVKAQGGATVLKSSSATVQAGGTWISDAMDMSHQINGTYTVMVTGTNSAGIEVSESQSFTLAQSLPTLTNVTFTPEHQAIGQSVTVTLEFDKDLQSAAAELGGTTITSLVATADPSVWTGDVVVPSTSELNVGLHVRDYQDLSGNTGSQNTAYSMPITPTLAITPVGNVDEAHAATLQFEGTSTRFDSQSLRLEVKAQGSATVLKSSSATVQAGGNWTSDAMDMSHQTNGTYTVMVTGTNSAGIEVSESQSFTLAQSLPTLTNVMFTPEHQAIGQSVTVTLEFDKDLQSAAAELGGTTITSLVATADPSVWTGDVVVPSTSELNVALLVRDYQDLSGNTGSQNTAYSMPITPTIHLDVINDVTGVESVTVSGSSERFEDGEFIDIKAVDADGTEATGMATVLSDSWTTDLDLSGLKEGVVTIYVNGTNKLSASAEEAQATFNYDRFASTASLGAVYNRYFSDNKTLKNAA